MPPHPGWKTLIRFLGQDGTVHYGEPSDDMLSAVIWEGSEVFRLTKTNRTEAVSEILAPCTPDTILCVGLNYKEHASEAGMKLPSYPVIFQKSKNAVTGPTSPIPMPDPNHATMLDYENELCIVTSHDAKNISEADAPAYILGYTVGNDVSSRQWQLPDRSGGQACYAKNFDGFCPIGPRLVAPELIPDPQVLRMTTRRQGKVVQNSSTADMLFGVNKIISFLSQGTTIPAGSLIMTGTPPGVAMFASKPPVFLEAGEVVECEIEGIGTLRNEFRMEMQ